ncbi:MAG: class I SAM-dependent methyltransferase [Spirochaetaceae bacterium]|jgi:SAM-dependent methyltransferase|nr:class I SAM-dependent methyltransferase [Spirochaetaceae bacterium]
MMLGWLIRKVPHPKLFAICAFTQKDVNSKSAAQVPNVKLPKAIDNITKDNVKLRISRGIFMDKMQSGYKSVSSIYDKYITSGNLFFKTVSKIIWGFEDRDYSIKLLENIPNNFDGKILDIPAGTGILTVDKYKQLNNPEIICMDYSTDMLKIAKERFENNNLKNIECKQGDVGNIPFENGTFDIVELFRNFSF